MEKIVAPFDSRDASVDLGDLLLAPVRIGDDGIVAIDRAVILAGAIFVSGWKSKNLTLKLADGCYKRTYRRPDLEQHYGDKCCGFVMAAPAKGATDTASIHISATGGAFHGHAALQSSQDVQSSFLNEQSARLREICASLAAYVPQWKDVEFKDAPTGPNHVSAIHHQAAVDNVTSTSGNKVLISGWSVGEGSGRRSLVIGEQGVEVDILRGAVRFPRRDLVTAFPGIPQAAFELAGFASYIEWPTGTPPSSAEARYGNWKVGQVQIAASNAAVQPIERVKVILGPLDISAPDMPSVLDRLGPAVSDIAFPTSYDVSPQVRQFGTKPAAPIASVLVPLYGRFDFVEHQLNQFSLDPDFRQVDLIYVLDDPKLATAFLQYCIDVHPLYEVPFRAITYEQNLGYAGANNVAAKFAESDKLLLLNSDVLPSESRWLSALCYEHSRLPNCGAMGVRLLFPDGSLQHDGMKFERAAFLGDFWINEHPGKGLPAPAVNGTGVVQCVSVTAACMLVNRKDFEAVGGFDEGYVIGDFEDSDLCLKLLENNRQNYVARNIVLFHLERQSQSLFGEQNSKNKLTVYNCWRHHRKWEKKIQSLAKQETRL